MNMNLDRPWMSVVIATYNSEQLLEKTIASIRLQKVPTEGLDLEILAVDGGSQDGTLELAQQLGIEVVKNDLGHAISAKHIGLLRARSNLVCFLDHDEQMIDEESLLRKFHLFEGTSRLRAVVTSGYELTRDQSGANCYTSEFGDPFSCYLYRTPNRNNFRARVLEKNFEVIEKTARHSILRAKSESKPMLLEFVAAGAVVDRDYYLASFPNLVQDRNIIPHLYSLLDANDYFAITVNDPIYHQSADRWRNVTHKINWKIANSVFQTDQNQLAGVEGRLRLESNVSFSRKKIGFVFYTVLLVPVLLDSIWMAIRRKNHAYLMQIPLSLYVIGTAALFLTRKTLRLGPIQRRYDGSKSPNQEL